MQNNIEFSNYLDIVCSQIHFQRAHNGLRKELRAHLEDQFRQYLDEGETEDSAIKLTIEQMGDPIALGNQLNDTHKPQTEWLLVVLTGLFIVLGCFVFYMIQDNVMLENGYVLKYIMYILTGILVGIGLYFFDYTLLNRHSYFLYFCGLIIMLLAINSGDKGSTISRLDLFAAILFVTGFSGILEKSRNNQKSGFFKAYIFALVPLIFCLLYPRTVITLCLFAAFITLLFISIRRDYFGSNKKPMLIYTVVNVFLFVGYAVWLATPKLVYHFNKVIFSMTEPDGAGYVYTQIHNLLTHSKLFGQSTYLANFKSIFEILPEIKNDHILTYLIASFGWITGIFILCSSLILITRYLLIALKIKSGFGFNLSVCLGVFLFVEFIIAALENFGLIPVVATFGFPFISIGGIGFVGNSIIIGLLLSIWRANQIIKDNMTSYSDHFEFFTKKAIKK